MVKERTNQICALGNRTTILPNFPNAKLLAVVSFRSTTKVVYTTLNEKVYGYWEEKKRPNLCKGQNTSNLNQVWKQYTKD